jgi:hypothetical protein
MNKELEVNWKTRHKDVGEIIIKTIDLTNGYVLTDSKTYPTFGIDSMVAKSCFPTIPMLMSAFIKQALTKLDKIKEIKDNLYHELGEIVLSSNGVDTAESIIYSYFIKKLDEVLDSE